MTCWKRNADLQFQNTQQFLVKAFKRHYRKVKEIAEILVESEDLLCPRTKFTTLVLAKSDLIWMVSRESS